MSHSGAKATLAQSLADQLAKLAAKDDSSIGEMAHKAVLRRDEELREERKQRREQKRQREEKKSFLQQKRKVRDYERRICGTFRQGLLGNLYPCSLLKWRPGRSALAFGRPCVVKWCLTNGEQTVAVVKYELPQELIGIAGRSTRWAVVPLRYLEEDPRMQLRRHRKRKLVRIKR